jgi:hypothetical protein
MAFLPREFFWVGPLADDADYRMRSCKVQRQVSLSLQIALWMQNDSQTQFHNPTIKINFSTGRWLMACI